MGNQTGGTNHCASILYPPPVNALSPSSSSFISSAICDWSRTILAATRHCTQPVLIFNEGSGPSAAAFWAFNGRVSRWHFCAVTSQTFLKIGTDAKAFTVLHSSVMNEPHNQGVNTLLEISRRYYNWTIQKRCFWRDKSVALIHLNHYVWGSTKYLFCTINSEMASGAFISSDCREAFIRDRHLLWFFIFFKQIYSLIKFVLWHFISFS